jgi:hypothetical protein
MPRCLALAVVASLALLALAACGGDEVETSFTPPENDADDDTENGDDDSVPAPPEEPAYFRDRPDLLDRSLWHDEVRAGDGTTMRALGGQGVGNGRVFAAVATTFPLNVFHNAIGPDYEKGLRFFSDKKLAVTVGAHEQEWGVQWAWRVRGTPIAITRATSGVAELSTVDFAPWLAEGDSPAMRAIVRVVVVRNVSRGPIAPVGLTLGTALGAVKDGAIVEENGSGKTLTIRPLPDAKGRAFTWEPREARRVWMRLPDLPPGGEVVVPLAFVFTGEGEDPEGVFAALWGWGTDALLQATVATWREWGAASATIQTPDPMINDLFDAIRVTTKSQQAATGATCPMYRYTRMWIRDTIGPARFFGGLGLLPDVRAMLDYFWYAVNERGGLSNSIDANRVFDAPPPVIDWADLEPGSGRTAAETPSYIPLQYDAYYRATGDLDLVRERYPMLRYCVTRQRFEQGLLLPFSGDETFRVGMAAALGLPLTLAFEDEYLSTNSSILLVAALRVMERFAVDLGYDADALEYRALATDVRVAMDAATWNDADGFYAPMVDRETLAPWPAPFEDVNATLLWTGAVDRDDARAERDLLVLLSRALHGEGIVATPLAWPYNLVFYGFGEAMFTGMTQGYVLHSLAELDHPAAEASFFAAAATFVDSGSVAEGHLYPSLDQVLLLNDPLGPIGDFSARNRPWEGGIMGAALLHYLLGARVDVPKGEVRLTPHLPVGWDRVAASALPFGDARYAVEVTGGEGTRAVRVAAGDAGFTVGLTLSIPSENVTAVTVDGAPVDLGTVPVQVRWGITRITLPAVALGPGEETLAAATFGK